jgi:hypothetical protein
MSLRLARFNMIGGHMRSGVKILSVVFAMSSLAWSFAANADVGVSLRAGTLGLGADVNIGLTENLNLRLGYSLYDYDETIEETDVTYDGELKLRNATALLDWHAFGGGFRFSFGGVGANTEVDVVGKPTGGTYEIGDRVFTAAQVGSLTGKIEMGNSVAPYLGIGWGNTVDAAGRVTFLFDIGVVYMGSPEVSLVASCGASVPAATCAQLRDAVEQEEAELQDDATDYEWYPVIGIGLAVKF